MNNETLQWDTETDTDGNTEYVAPSCWHYEGSPFQWRLRQKLEDDAIVWIEAHDAELLDGLPDTFDSLEFAKSAIEVKHAAHLADLKKEAFG